MCEKVPRIVVAVLACGLAGNASARADAANPERRIDFVRDVRPILAEHCFRCHGEEKQQSNYRLDRQSVALKGGDYGNPPIIPGKSNESPLIDYLTGNGDLTMPPEGAPLSAEDIATLRVWIDQGAVWSGDAELEGARVHWSFQPVIRPAAPRLDVPGFDVRNPIDAFILEKLNETGLSPSPEADRRTLIRRVSFDVVGLPPSPEEVEQFVNDGDPAAYDKLIERLLASPHFGERWARHWLDVARFAESHGFEMNQTRPNAWPYRDYVIRAFNEDKPYDRFVIEQLAGDALGTDEATGFLVAGPWDQVKSPDPVLTAQQRTDELHDMVSTTGSAFLGLTVGCARCHSHKFDPISQTDYYSITAALAGVRHGERAIRAGDSPEHLRPPVQPGMNVERFAPTLAKFLRFTVYETDSGVEPCLDELEVLTAEMTTRNVALAANGAKVTASGTLAGFAIHKLGHVNDGRYGNDWSWISSERGRGWVEVEFVEPATIDRVSWSRDRSTPPQYTDRLATRYEIAISLDRQSWQTVASSDGRQPLDGGRRIYAGVFVNPDKTYRLHRGDPMQPKEETPPGGLSELGGGWRLPAASDQERRLALARWIASTDNTLAARVIVNRLWHYHFGRGIVETPSDFGVNGGRPSHPELLDWLASELVHPQAGGTRAWSLKHIHRLILLSSTYRQSSRANSDSLARDAQTRLLWRFSPKRLEAEAIRDAVLCASGQLDRRMGGPGFDLFEPNTNYVKVYTPKRDFGPDTFRRLIYQQKPRMQLDDTFGAFDCPDAGQIAPRRSTSTTPLQALNLLNGPFLVQQAEFFAERLAREASASDEQTRRALLIAFGREPTGEETAAAKKLIERHGLAAFTRAIFNCNEFIVVD
jgi:cytochrome c553